MPQRYFLDTSALVPRYFRLATGHAWVSAFCAPAAAHLIAVVEITGVEFASALNQMVRGGLLPKRLCERRIATFWSDVDGGEYRVVSVTPTMIRRASDLCSIHSLKGYDAVQLAAAILYRDNARAFDASAAASGQPIFGDPIFLTEDNRLAAAATAEGFTVDSPLAHP